MASKWRPRASSIGYYTACLQRAAFDRAVDEGLIPSEMAERRDSPPAAFGDVCHFMLQDGVRARFPSTRKPDPRHIQEVAESAGVEHDVAARMIATGAPMAFKPSPETEKLAAEMFRGDITVMKQSAQNIVLRGYPHLPVLEAGDEWEAEVVVETPNWTGHADLVSKSRKWLVDIKTSSKAQLYATKEYGNCLREAFAQTALYNSALKCENVGILYLDTKQPFAHFSKIDQTDEYKAYCEQLNAVCKLVRSNTFLNLAFPQLLDHRCGETWCPYKALCRDVIRPHHGPAQVSTDMPLAAAGDFKL
jgi:hypothetical protein